MRRWTLLTALVGVLVFVAWFGCANPNLAGGKLHWEQASRIEDPTEREARFRRALETFEQARKEMPANAEVRLWLGRTFAELDMPDSASANFARASELDQRFAEDVRNTRGHYYSHSYNEALTVAGEAVDSRASGDLETANDQFREALELFQKAQIYDPDQHKVYTMIGKVNLNLGEVDEALAMMRKARELAPDDPEVNRDLFMAYRDQANDAYQAGSEKVQEGDSTQARSLFEGAQELYAQANEIEPDDTDILFMQGATAYELAQLAPDRKDALLGEAIEKYMHVLEQNPADVEVLYNLALVLRDQDRNEEAVGYARRLVDLRPTDGTYREILGRIEDKLGNKDALVSGIVFGRALKTGIKVDAGTAGSRADAFGPASDLKRRFLEAGPPEEILSFTDSQGQQYEVWFYWLRGRGYGFLNGQEKFSSEFAPYGVLEVNSLEIRESGVSKVVAGTVSNAASRPYEYVRVTLNLFDEEDNEIGRTVASVDHLDARGDWRFEVPLTGRNETAARAELEEILGY